MLEAVLVVLLGLHLLMVDVAMAGPLACVWLEWRETRHGDRAAGRAGYSLARLVNWALTGGIALGVVLLAARWWLDDKPYFAAVAAVPTSRLWYAGMELVFFFACMGAYMGLWNRWRNWRLAHRALAIAAASNLLIHFPALFTVISVASARPALVAEPLDAAGFRSLLLDGEVLSRVAHVWMAALAVTGAAVMALGLRIAADAALRAEAGRIVRRGAALALVPTMLQIPIGLWVTMEMPEVARDPLLGGDLVATGMFAASLVLALTLLHHLAAIALGDDGSRQVRRAIAVLCVLVLLMVGTRSHLDSRAAAAAARQADLLLAKQSFQ